MEEEQVLTIDQMKELEALGFDTSNASCMWVSIQDKDYKPIKWLPVFRGEDRESIEVLRHSFPHTCQEGNIYYCYTLNDILNILPNYSISYLLGVYKITVKIEGQDNIMEGFTLIDTVFNLLVAMKKLGQL